MNNDGTEPGDSFLEDAPRFFRQPTASEVSRLTDVQLRDLRVCAEEEASNDFAHLLNGGSSLE